MVKKEIIGTEKLGVGTIIVRGLGYLRVPEAFRQVFGAPKYYPEPSNVLVAEEKRNILLIYKFPKAKMDALKKTGDDSK